MHPTTARYLVESRHADLRAEAEAERIARQVRRNGRSKTSAQPAGFVGSARHLVAALLAIA